MHTVHAERLVFVVLLMLTAFNAYSAESSHREIPGQLISPYSQMDAAELKWQEAQLNIALTYEENDWYGKPLELLPCCPRKNAPHLVTIGCIFIVDKIGIPEELILEAVLTIGMIGQGLERYFEPTALSELRKTTAARIKEIEKELRKKQD